MIVLIEFMLLYFPLHIIYIMGDNGFYLGLNISWFPKYYFQELFTML